MTGSPTSAKVGVTVDIRELSADGTYVPAELIDHVFQLHQGLQRRIHFRLAIESETPLSGPGLTAISLGNIRHIQTKAQATTVLSSRQIEQAATPVTTSAQEPPDSPLTLETSWGWDTAAHDCAQLDKRMGGDEQLLLALQFQLDANGLAKPATFSLELPIRIVGRNQKRSSFMSFWSASKIATSLVQDFQIDFAYPRPMTVAQLAYVDTSSTPLVDEELAGEFRVRGLNLLDDFERYRKVAAWPAEVQLTRAVLRSVVSSGRPEETSRPDRSTEAQEKLLRRCLALWQTAIDRRPMRVRTLTMTVAER